jgi:sugar fermentation stimulation protein A
MDYQKPLFHGRIQKRYKRFLADVLLENGELITAHTPNTGSMKTCWEKDWPVLLSQSDNPKRKLKFTLEMTSNGKTWINVNTSRTNHIAFEAVKNLKVKELSGYQHIRPEVKVGDSRIDLLLFDGDEKKYKESVNKCYVEVKNVTLWRDGMALFPDGVSTRGQKHLNELISIKQQGHEAAMLFVVSREDVTSFGPAEDIDPVYAELLKKAQKAGVKILAYQCSLSEKETTITKSIPVIL